ncbi:hypothetical protein E2R68_02190 [Psychromonas sp. RZ22]|nr:transporter [Psychromonas sp. RZ22]TEW55922.1 hypothetical protein E2R68_02190 [Psychromonas sp. RZ22]
MLTRIKTSHCFEIAIFKVSAENFPRVMGLCFGWGNNHSEGHISPTGKPSIKGDDSVTGFTDLYPIVSLAWNEDKNNWMTYVTGGIPVGDYDSSRLANIGIGHSAIDIGGGYTYFNETSGREFLAVLGATYNFENYHTGSRWLCLRSINGRY